MRLHFLFCKLLKNEKIYAIIFKKAPNNIEKLYQ